MRMRNWAIKVLCGLLLISSGVAYAQDAPPVDTDAPTVFITSPSPGTLSNSITEVRGTASDANSDIAKVEVEIAIQFFNGAPLSYWNGSTYVESPVAFAAQLQQGSPGTVDWSMSNLPPVLNGRAIHTVIRATAIDSASNRSQIALSDYDYDLILPAFYFNNPSNLSREFDSLIVSTSNYFYDKRAGITNTVFTLRRNIDGMYWNGRQWQKVSALLPMQQQNPLDRTQFKNSVPLPSGTLLKEGKYAFQVTFTDALLNRFTSNLIAGIDKTPPVMRMSEPRPNARVYGLTRLTGTVKDNGGSYISIQVSAQIKRRRDNTYWNWYEQKWTRQAPDLGSVYTSNSAGWAMQGVPHGKNLAAGLYTVEMIAIDAVGNRSDSTADFTVMPSKDVPPVKIISVKVDNNGAISLRFSAPLFTGFSPRNFTVVVDGQLVTVFAPQYNASVNTITFTLQTGSGSLTANSQVDITWNGLIAANGLIVPAGATTITVPAPKP